MLFGTSCACIAGSVCTLGHILEAIRRTSVTQSWKRRKSITAFVRSVFVKAERNSIRLTMRGNSRSSGHLARAPPDYQQEFELKVQLTSELSESAVGYPMAIQTFQQRNKPLRSYLRRLMKLRRMMQMAVIDSKDFAVRYGLSITDAEVDLRCWTAWQQFEWNVHRMIMLPNSEAEA